MTPSATTDLPDTAEGWVARLDAPHAGPAEAAAFDAWCARDPSHRPAYRAARQLHDMARRLRDNDMLRAAAREALRATARRRTARRRWFGAAAVAASLLVALPAVWWYLRTPMVTADYATQTRIATVTLPDGTRMVMDAGTRASIRFDGEARQVLLERGRAQFRVGKAEAPFEVRAGEVTVRDIGTTFQVRRGDADTRVALLEGQVTVSDARQPDTRTLSPGQAVRVGADGHLDAALPLDAAEAEGWTQGRLVFRGERLADLLATMNRYAARRITLADAGMGELRVSGSFHAGDQDALVSALVAGWQLRPERLADGTVVLHDGATAVVR
jgi:transmembrane sensor